MKRTTNSACTDKALATTDILDKHMYTQLNDSNYEREIICSYPTCCGKLLIETFEEDIGNSTSYKVLIPSKVRSI